MSPDESSPFFSAECVGGSEYQEFLVFRREQLQAWVRVNDKQMLGQRVTKKNLEAIEPVVRLILRAEKSAFEAKVLINSDRIPRGEVESLLETIGEAFLDPLQRDGMLLVYYADMPYRYEWS